MPVMVQTRRSVLRNSVFAGVGLTSTLIGPSWQLKNAHAEECDKNNILLTHLLRKQGERRRHWGNWSFNSDVEVGAVGKLSANDGSFEKHTLFSDMNMEAKSGGHEWDFKSKGVEKRTGEMNANVNAEAPVGSSGATAGGGGSLTVSWSFEKANSLATHFVVEKDESIRADELHSYINHHMEELKDYAKSADMFVNEKIRPGFGVITRVIWASSGLNVASTTENASFSISGSREAVGKMAGVGEVQTEISGRYENKTQNDTTVSSTWPSKEKSDAPGLVPIAFEFASFDREGNLVTGWIGDIENFTIFIEHKGTWSTHGDLDYTIDDAPQPTQKFTHLSAGRNASFTIPRNARDVK